MTLKTLRSGAAVIMGLVGGGLFGSGCSKSDSSPTIVSFCAQKAEKECGTKDKGVAHDCGATVAACTAAREAVCMTVADQESLTHPLRADAIANCLNQTATVYAAATITPALRAVADDACARVFSGKNKNAEACATDYDCDTGLVCDRSVALCAKPTPAAANAYCNDPGATCPDTQYCAGTYPARLCTDKKAAGLACDAVTPCLDTLRCLNAVCADKVGTRGACTSDADCAPAAPYCDPYNGNECFLGFTPASAGGTNECVAFGGPTAGAGGAAGSNGAAGASGAGGAGGGSGAGGAGGGVGLGLL